MTRGEDPVAVVENPAGSGSCVIVCDHASNRIPEDFASPGFKPELLETHIAWDPGALGVARYLSIKLDAPLIWPDASRLLIDCNRPLDSNSLIVVETERGVVEGNRDLSPEDRRRRIDRIHKSYHAAIDACLDRRADTRPTTAFIAIHSFTPIFFGKVRPWEVGIVFGEDRRLADCFIRELRADASLTVGINEPYSPADQVYYTVERHAAPRRLLAAMIEIRNDEIASDKDQRRWAERLAKIMMTAERKFAGASHATV